MATGPLLVLSEVLKTTAPFKAIHISNTTGMSRQLVYKHLNSLVTQGLLEKTGVQYSVSARDEIIELMLEKSNNKITGLLEGKVPLLIPDYKLINEVFTVAVNARSSGTPGALRLQQTLNKQIEEAILSLKGLRKYLNTKQINKKQSTEFVERNFDSVWANLSGSVNMDKETFRTEVTNLIITIEEDKTNE